MSNVRWIISVTVQYNFVSLAVPRPLHLSYIARPRSLQRPSFLLLVRASVFFFLPAPFFLPIFVQAQEPQWDYGPCQATLYLYLTYPGGLICMIEHRGFVKPPRCKSTLYTYMRITRCIG